MIELRATATGVCPICQDEIGSRPTVHLPCGHSLHLACHKKLCKSQCQTREQCPSCRASFLQALPQASRQEMVAGRTGLEIEYLMQLTEDPGESGSESESGSEGYVYAFTLDRQPGRDSEMVDAARRIRRRTGMGRAAGRPSLAEQAAEMHARRLTVQGMRRAARLREALQETDESVYGMGIAQLVGDEPHLSPERIEQAQESEWPALVANLATQIQGVFLAPSIDVLFDALALRRD